MGERQIRRTQAAGVAGVGAIVDVLGESFVAEDTSRWVGRWEFLKAPGSRPSSPWRTCERHPPRTAGAGLPFYRFPTWLFCGQCRVMTRWRVQEEKKGELPRCQSCLKHPQLVPMRFVAVCGNGHLEDVNWVRWAHSKAWRQPGSA